jgi:uncharacterized protein
VTLSTRIVIFAKAPVPGAAKTRLIPALGAAGAARLAARMLSHTVEQAVAAGVGNVELCASPSPEAPAWDGFRPAQVAMTAQGAGDLGERLCRAAARVVDVGEHPMLIGSDCPELDAPLLRSAADRLEHDDAMMHPTHDGGYALLGLRRHDPSLFSGIRWSTDAVAAQTLERLRALNWSVHLGATLRDIDEPCDLAAPTGSRLAHWLA